LILKQEIPNDIFDKFLDVFFKVMIHFTLDFNIYIDLEKLGTDKVNEKLDLQQLNSKSE